jgi:type IV pilus assembly protein PilE
MKINNGFTLIELMIVVAIVSILAAVAVPSYQQYVLSGKRAEGKAFALDIASRQERHFTQNSRYAGTLSGTASAIILGMNSDTSENDIYTAVVTQLNGTATFLITLTPAIPDSTCGALTLTNTGDRDKVGGTGTAAECWR